VRSPIRVDDKTRTKMRDHTEDLFGSTPWLNAPWHDALTGALTRQHFIDLLAEELVHAEQSGLPFVLWIADIDGLRELNERWGQQAGDMLLTAAAQRLRELLGRQPWHNLDACFARFGGDSFILLARECDRDHGLRLADHYRQRIAAGPVVDHIGLTVSIGVAESRSAENVDELIARAETALHLAKQFGPDNVELAPAPAEPLPRGNVVPLRSRLRRHG
jgi:diguanylate cyclase